MSIEHVFDVFFTAGPEVNYGYRTGSPGYVRSTYPTYGMLQSATNADSVEMAFLATDDNYQAVRALQLRNLIVPVVGDFGGPSAIRSVGKWLREREMTVTAFYVSNVEQYLFRESGSSERFYGNVSSLPIDSTSRFIRSVPRTSGAASMMSFGSAGLTRGGIVTFTIPRDSVKFVMRTIRDSAGVVVLQDSARRDTAARVPTSRDSAGTTRLFEITSRTARDSVPRDTGWASTLRARRDSIRGASWQVVPGAAMTVVMGGMLTSGLASMKGTLEAFFLGELKTYNAVVEMTKVSGWR